VTTTKITTEMIGRKNN